MDKVKSQKSKFKSSNQKLKPLFFIFAYFFLLFTFTFLLLPFNLYLHAQDKIVAIVNKDIITQKDLNDFINFMRVQLMTKYPAEQLEGKLESMKSDLLDRLIEDRLILQEARKENIRIDENRVEAKIDEIKKGYASETEFRDTLTKQGLSQADIESRIREQLLMYNIVDIKIRSKIVINPVEVTEFYQENMAEFNIPELREFEFINLNDENMAKELFNSLKEGKSLKDLAEKYSLVVNALTARRGQELRKEIEDVVFVLKIGEISEPVKIEMNSYIFKLNNIIPGRQKNLAEVQDKIYNLLFDMKMQKQMSAWLDELKKHSYIKIVEG